MPAFPLAFRACQKIEFLPCANVYGNQGLTPEIMIEHTEMGELRMFFSCIISGAHAASVWSAGHGGMIERCKIQLE